MFAEPTLIYALKGLFLPPGGNLLLITLAILIGRRLRVLGLALFWLGLGSLYLMATPFVADRLLRALEPAGALNLAALKAGEENSAIVVLAGGRREGAPEYEGADTVSTYTLERLRYAAQLQKRTRLPMLLTGGRVFGRGVAEAVLMNEALIGDFRATPTWLETESRNTAENAENALKILQENGVTRIYLVTHAFHMGRALQQFSQPGITVVPAPCAFVSRDTEASVRDWLPSATALHRASLALHEVVGGLWYRMAY